MTLNVIRQRASVRDYSDKRISDIEIRDILEAARLAPSWMNVQPWHFITITENETKELLSKLANGQKQILKASHVILVVADLSAWDKEKFQKILKHKPDMSEEKLNFIFNNPGLYPKLMGEDMLLARTIEQCTYATSHIVLQAKTQGIESCIIGAFGNELTNSNLELYKEIKEKLHIPEKHFITTIITLGYPKEETKKPLKIRKEFDEVVSKEIYGQKY